MREPFLDAGMAIASHNLYHFTAHHEQLFWPQFIRRSFSISLRLQRHNKSFQLHAKTPPNFSPNCDDAGKEKSCWRAMVLGCCAIRLSCLREDQFPIRLLAFYIFAIHTVTERRPLMRKSWSKLPLINGRNLLSFRLERRRLATSEGERNSGPNA